MNLLKPHQKNLFLSFFLLTFFKRFVVNNIISKVLYLCKGALGCDVYFLGVSKYERIRHVCII